MGAVWSPLFLMNDFDLETPRWPCQSFLRPAPLVLSFLLPFTRVTPASHPEFLLLSLTGNRCPLGTPHLSPSLLGDNYRQVQHNLVEDMLSLIRKQRNYAPKFL